MLTEAQSRAGFYQMEENDVGRPFSWEIFEMGRCKLVCMCARRGRLPRCKACKLPP